jgi:hypothetical protein
MTSMVALLLVVRVFDRSGQSLEDRTVAVRTADAILRQAEVTSRWIDCSADARATASACTTPALPGELAMRITPAPPEPRPTTRRALGYSLVEPEVGGGTLGTVFSDRVAWLAEASRTSRQALLGRAIAHEIGHLLLGTNEHPRHGLMRAVWTAADLRRNRDDDWRFTQVDVARLRRSRLAADPIRFAEAGGGSDSMPDTITTITFDSP